ncbi:unnamed protein product [Malus baccata var. baccata]
MKLGGPRRNYSDHEAEFGMPRFHHWLEVARACVEDYKPDEEFEFDVEFSLPSYYQIRRKEDKLGIALEEEPQNSEMEFDCDKNSTEKLFQDKKIEFVSPKNSTCLRQDGVCKSDSTRDILASHSASNLESYVVLEFKHGCTPQHITTHERPKAMKITPTFEFHDTVCRHTVIIDDLKKLIINHMLQFKPR